MKLECKSKLTTQILPRNSPSSYQTPTVVLLREYVEALDEKSKNVKIKLLGNNGLIMRSPSLIPKCLSLSFQMRYTKKVSMWPVGLITKYGVSSPIVRNGTISGFYDGWIGGRKFPVDMAGFAVNVNFLLSRPNASMPYKPGYEEDGFLKSLSPLNLTEIELMASNCTQVCSCRSSNSSKID